MPEVSEYFNTRIRPEYLKNIRALAHFKSELSQRIILEQALDLYFKKHKATLDRALKHYEEKE